MNELDDLIRDRQEKVRLMKKDGDNSHKLLAELYGSPTHFITELLQNAEDEGANNVSFRLTQNELEFSHDAKKFFDFGDIRAISNFGDNHEKKEKPNAIGRFGIGFKSVYSITDIPRIVSAEYDITIIDYNVPLRTENANHKYYKGTKIILPFKKKNREKTYEMLERELKDLNIQYLLFLSNISSIKWKTENDNGVYERAVKKKDKRFISLLTKTKEKKYILLEKQVEIEKKTLSVKLAFQLGDQERKVIVPCDKSPLFVFFPTKIETNLKFLVHAPFYTTPARENIQEEDDPISIQADHRNEELKVELGKLLATSLTTFKNLKLLSVDLMNVLPIDEDYCERSIIYRELYQAVKTEFLSEKELIPNSNGGFSALKDVMLLGSADLADLVTKKQAIKIFERKFWVSKKITNDKTKQLRDYIYVDLDAPEYDLTAFVSKLDSAFMLEQTDSWIIQFYRTVHKANALWRTSTNLSQRGILRGKPIIRVQSKEGIKQMAPFQSDGKPNVFLPTKENSKYPTVKLNISKNKEARRFLDDLGLTSPDIFAELNEFVIPKFDEGEVYQGYFDDFKKILEAVQSSNKEKRTRLIQDLKDTSAVLGYNLETGETKLLKPREVYLLTDKLKRYFARNSSVFFVAEEQFSLNAVDKLTFRALMKELGVSALPRRIEFSANLSWQEKRNLRNGDMTYEYYCKDYNLEGLSEFFKQEINLENSVILWELLVEMATAHPYSAEDLVNGEYKYKYYSDFTVRFESTFLKQLKQNAWIVLDGVNVRPCEISHSSLPTFYTEKGYDLKALTDILEFKPDEIREIEARTGGRFLSADEYEKYRQWKLEQAKNEKDAWEDDENEVEEDFSPDFKADEADLNSRELDESDVSIEFTDNHIVNSTSLEANGHESQPSTNPAQSVSTTNYKLLKSIGNWGEEYVFRSLLNEFDDSFEIVDLNKDGQVGVGADFKVMKDGKIIRLVEVKSSTLPFGQMLIVSGTQWEIARNYFNQFEGDKYWLYCVFNAGQANVEIVKVNDPIKKWKDGKLFAHPINFQIR
jgi:hypothetical protein